MMADLYDVLAVDMSTHKVQVLDVSKTAKNADAIICFAVARRGVETYFYVTAEAGKYQDNDEWLADDDSTPITEEGK